MKNRIKSVRRLTVLSILVAICASLSFIESKIPSFVPIPFLKIGLANIAVIFTLYKLGTKEAFFVSLVRVFLMGLLFGSFVSLLFSFCGAILSLTLMFIVRKFDFFSEVGVSTVGGVSHNIGQILIATVVLQSGGIIVYLPVLLIGGVISGTIIGLVSAVLVRKIKLEI